MTWFNANLSNSGGGGSGGYKNVWDGSLINNVYIDSGSGAVVSYGGWSATDFIDIETAIEVYRVGGLTGASWNAFYDVNKAYVSSAPSGSITSVPSGARYVRFSNDTRYMNGMVLIEA